MFYLHATGPPQDADYLNIFTSFTGPISMARLQRAVLVHFTLIPCTLGGILPLYSYMALFEDFAFSVAQIAVTGKFSKFFHRIANSHPTKTNVSPITFTLYGGIANYIMAFHIV